MLPPTLPSDGVASMASGACPWVESKEIEVWAAGAASAPLSAGPWVGVLVLGGPLLFWLLLLLSLKRCSKGVKGLRQQMGSSEGLGARAAMA